MGIHAFARHQFLYAVIIQVGQSGDMRLRPRLVNHVLLPNRRAVELRRLLLPPVHAVVVSATEQDVQNPSPFTSITAKGQLG
jgi:hypothetical protein